MCHWIQRGQCNEAGGYQYCRVEMFHQTVLFKKRRSGDAGGGGVGTEDVQRGSKFSLRARGHCDQADRAQQSRCNRLNLVHILWLEALAVAQVEEPVIGQAPAGHIVDSQVCDDEPDIILAWVKQAGYVKRIWRAPDRARSPIIYIYNDCLAHWSFEPG